MSLKSRRLTELEATRCWNQYLVLSTQAALKASLHLKGRPRSSLSLLSEHLRVDPGVARGKNWTVGPRISIRNSEDPILQLVAGCRERIFSVTKEEKTCSSGLCNFFFWSSWGLGNQGSDASRGAACTWCVDQEIRKKLEHKQIQKRASHKEEEG